MLKIQVLGSGLIPRGYGLAPRREPFPADLTLIQTIMSTPGLRVNMITPDDNRTIELNNGNVKRLWDKYTNKQPSVPTKTTVTNPVTPKTPEPDKSNNTTQEQPKPQQVNTQPVTSDVKKDTPEEDKKEETSDKTIGGDKGKDTYLKPINSDDKKNGKANIIK